MIRCVKNVAKKRPLLFNVIACGTFAAGGDVLSQKFEAYLEKENFLRSVFTN